MKSYISRKKDRLSTYLNDFFSNYGATLKTINPTGVDLVKKLLAFTLKGKMLRGALVNLGYELFSPPNEAVTIPLGAVQELFQSALLIHDDIMDRDRYRRGSPSIYAQYILFAEQENFSDPEHAGEALGICAGDIAYFLAFEILSHTVLPDHLKTKLLTLCSKELTRVGVAQMVDVVWGSKNTPRSVEEILHLYTYKTARYTFSLPLMAGAIATEQDDLTIASLEKIGIKLGILFQIKDDELGMFGGIEAIGKPVGSDIREAKKTLFYHYLLQKTDEDKKQQILSLFGKKDLTAQDITLIREQIIELGIKEKVDSIVKQIAAEAEAEISKLSCRNEQRQALLKHFLTYSLERTH